MGGKVFITPVNMNPQKNGIHIKLNRMHSPIFSAPVLTIGEMKDQTMPRLNPIMRGIRCRQKPTCIRSALLSLSSMK